MVIFSFLLERKRGVIAVILVFASAPRTDFALFYVVDKNLSGDFLYAYRSCF